MALGTETDTAQEYIQSIMDERDRRYMEMFRSEQRADELIMQRLDQLQRDGDKNLDSVAQRFSDKLDELNTKVENTNRLFWTIIGAGLVIEAIIRLFNVKIL